MPNDIKEVLTTLIDRNVRADCGIHKDNLYVSANGQDSKDHCIGCRATNTVATEAGVKRIDLFNATSNRHRISTFYSMLELIPAKQKVYLQHMGHSEKRHQRTFTKHLPP